MLVTTRQAVCSCGQLSLRVEGDARRIGVCHCLACQRRTGSAFGYQAHFGRAQVHVAGSAKAYVRVAESGNQLTFYFCPTCGATVYYLSAAQPDLIGVPIGAFAEPGFGRPMFSAWEGSKHTWLEPHVDADSGD
jgi:hypothetical protein